MLRVATQKKMYSGLIVVTVEYSVFSIDCNDGEAPGD